MKGKPAEGEGARFQVSSVEDAAGILDHFNGFHDGFMKRIAVESRDQMHADLSQSCTGAFDVVVDFAHYNYGTAAAPLHPHNQIVRAEFRNVADIFCDFREGFLGNTIMRLSIDLANRRQIGGTAVEQCLGLRLGRHFYLEEYRRYEYRESQLFTFTDATFTEFVG